MIDLASHGIRLGSKTMGNHKALCPRCSHDRKPQNRRDRCLSVKIEPDGHAVWNCHNCSWTGSSRSRLREVNMPRAPIAMPKPTIPAIRYVGALPQAVLAWFEARGISRDVVERNGIGFSEGAIQFPYRRGGDVVNIKSRLLSEKRFWQVKDAEKVFYGLDDVDGTEAIIVEGEMDKLALEEAGIRNVLSVPDGAPEEVRAEMPPPREDAKFAYLWNCHDMLDRLTKVILAVDGDGPGSALAEELARRIGRERCWRVSWPALNDVECKDANEVLLAFGPEVLREVIESAEPYPIRSLYRPLDFNDEVFALYRGDTMPALSTGWADLDKHMLIRPGELTVVTGFPGAGKSEFIDALAMNLIERHGWSVAFCSFENPPAEHLSKLIEKHIGAPFWPGPRQRMDEGNVAAGLHWLQERVVLIRADDESPTIEFILEKARAAVLRHGIKGLVIDPYNEIEHKRPPGMTETEYVADMLAKVKRFGQNHGVHVWFVAHPAKPFRDDKSRGSPLTLYDIAGSAHWVNKADIGIIVESDHNAGSAVIHVKKVRFKEVGKKGSVPFDFDRATGTYQCRGGRR